MKIYKSFNEIRGKVWKNYRENIKKIKKQLIRFKYFAEILKKIKLF